MSIDRRTFIKTGALLSALPFTSFGISSAQSKVTIAKVNSNFEREPLIRPFGFKGGAMTEVWQGIALMESEKGTRGVGLGSQNVLWSDAKVFLSHSEAGGNAHMYAITERALQMVKGESFDSPIDLQESILEELFIYAKKITGNPQLRKTFALNALVAVDNAAWMLYAKENKLKTFDEAIPAAYKGGLGYKHDKVASIPTVGYSIPISELTKAIDEGYFFLKMKIGQNGTQEEMLEKDKERLTQIHKAMGHRRTKYTPSGKLPYYIDANGRYESKDTLLRWLDHAKKIGAYDQIAVVEEPFREDLDIEVHDIEMRLAADESAHTDEDALQRIEMGYKSIALKAIAKTMSMTMKIAQIAHERNIPCFCADLTVNPILQDWNKVIASRLAPFPGLQAMGLQETNGHQNYKNWEQMHTYHPYHNSSWTRADKGIFNLNEDFYAKSGGIFEISDHYEKLVLPPFID